MGEEKAVSGLLGEILAAFDRYWLAIADRSKWLAAAAVCFCFLAGLLTIYALTFVKSLSEHNDVLLGLLNAHGIAVIPFFNLGAALMITSTYAATRRLRSHWGRYLHAALAIAFAGAFFLDFAFDLLLILASS